MSQYQITSPDGRQFEVTAPEGASQEDVLSYAKENFPKMQGVEAVKAPEVEQGFTERVSRRLGERRQEVSKTFEDVATGEITGAEGALQTLGKGAAGASLDIVGEGIISLGRGISAAVPDAIEDPIKREVVEGWDTLMNTDVGEYATEALTGGIEKWNEFKAGNPRWAKNIESGVNIAAIVSPVKAKAHAKPTTLGKASNYFEDIAGKQVKRKRKDFVGDLISPKKTPKVRAAETARTTEKGRGLLRRDVVELSAREKDIAAEVSKINGVTPKNSIQKNLNAIQEANQKIAKQLDADVGKRRILGLRATTSKKIDDAISLMVAENPVITGNAVTVANKISAKAKKIIESNPGTPKGLLDSRKQLDSWIKKQKGTKVFDPELESALSVAVRDVRNVINDSVEASTGSAAVKQELKKQSLLFDAIENLAPKAADAHNWAIGRGVQNMAKILPFRSQMVNEGSAILGLGLVGGSALLSPYFAGGLAATAITYAGHKAIMSATTKKMLSNTVKAMDKALLSAKQPSMVRQLRADRAAIIELMKTAEIRDDEAEKEQRKDALPEDEANQLP